MHLLCILRVLRSTSGGSTHVHPSTPCAMNSETASDIADYLELLRASGRAGSTLMLRRSQLGRLAEGFPKRSIRTLTEGDLVRFETVFAVQQLLGHARADTTQRYVRVGAGVAFATGAQRCPSVDGDRPSSEVTMEGRSTVSGETVARDSPELDSRERGSRSRQWKRPTFPGVGRFVLRALGLVTSTKDWSLARRVPSVPEGRTADHESSLRGDVDARQSLESGAQSGSASPALNTTSRPVSGWVVCTQSVATLGAGPDGTGPAWSPNVSIASVSLCRLRDGLAGVRSAIRRP